MPGEQPYLLIYAAAVSEHLGFIDAKHHSLIQQKIEEQLSFEPGVDTKNRKALRQPAAFEADWELRFGPQNRFRVLYSIDEPNRAVHILAIGEKQRDRLRIGGEEVKL